MLRPLAPPRQILFLFRSELVDFNPHGLELQARHALVEFFGNPINGLLQGGMVLHHVLYRERLVDDILSSAGMSISTLKCPEFEMIAPSFITSKWSLVSTFLLPVTVQKT